MIFVKFYASINLLLPDIAIKNFRDAKSGTQKTLSWKKSPPVKKTFFLGLVNKSGLERELFDLLNSIFSALKKQVEKNLRSFFCESELKKKSVSGLWPPIIFSFWKVQKWSFFVHPLNYQPVDLFFLKKSN